MTDIEAKVLTAIGHSRVSNDRCTAFRMGTPADAFGPGTLPEFCGLEFGHKGPHIHIYGTTRYSMEGKLIEHRTLGDICVKCRVNWPCKEAEAVLNAVKNKASVASLNKKFFSAGFSQGYGSHIGDIHRVDELYEKTKAHLCGCLDPKGTQVTAEEKDMLSP